MKITKEQTEVLNKFICERFSFDKDNLIAINNFHNYRGELLIGYLKNYGWEEDASGKTAFYLIKSPENEIVAFFSLKCGNVFETLNIEEMQQQTQIVKEMLRLIMANKNDKEMTLKLLEQYRSGQNLSFEELGLSINNFGLFKETLNYIKMDINKAIKK